MNEIKHRTFSEAQSKQWTEERRINGRGAKKKDKIERVLLVEGEKSRHLFYKQAEAVVAVVVAAVLTTFAWLKKLNLQVWNGTRERKKRKRTNDSDLDAGLVKLMTVNKMLWKVEAQEEEESGAGTGVVVTQVDAEARRPDSNTLELFFKFYPHQSAAKEGIPVQR